MTPPPGKLYIVPLPIAADTHAEVIPVQVVRAVRQLRYFLVENLRTARRYVKALAHPQPIDTLAFEVLDQHTTAQQVAAQLEPVLQGQDAGVLAEAGCPGIADPGAVAVQYAHQHGIPVVPLVGPSSVLLALMGSGLSGQSFAFQGYLPIAQQQRRATIRRLEKWAQQHRQTQIFIETPYRNQALLHTLLATCQSTTQLGIGQHLTAPDGWLQTQTVQQWQQHPPTLPKVPAIFMLGVHQ